MKARKTILILFVLFFLAVVAAGIVVALAAGKGKVAKKTILEVNLETELLEYVPADPVAQLMLKDKTQLRNVVDALTRAASDDRVAGVIARVGQAGFGVAQTQELRRAILDFRASGKPAYAWAETFGEVAPGTSSYYLATAFDKIFLQQSGDVNITGLILESFFLRGTFDKLGLVPRMDHRYEYKNAKNVLTETGYTEAHREVAESIMDSLMETLVAEMAEGRGMSVDEMRQRMAGGPYYGAETVEAGLVDELAYRDGAYAAIREAVGEDAELLYLGV